MKESCRAGRDSGTTQAIKSIQPLALAAAWACAMIITSVATAGPGAPALSAEIKSASVDGDAAYTFAGFGDSGLMVQKIFIEGLLPGDIVTAIFGDPISPATIQTSAGGFFNAPEFGQAHGQPSAALFASNPQLQWDTWVAIDSSMFSVGPGFPSIALPTGGNNVIANNNLAWFAIPGSPTITGSVLIGQFAFAEGSDFEITVSVSVLRGGFPVEIRNLTHLFTPPPQTGACCINGDCSAQTAQDCELAGGVFSGVGSECDAIECEGPPDPVGACCVSNECVSVTAEICATMGGEFSGVGSNCVDTDCAAPPDPIGACCVANECVPVTAQICATMGGAYSGDGTLCTAGLCDGPPNLNGACCVDGLCVEVTQEICVLMGSVTTSVFHGVGTVCSEVECDATPPAMGACCVSGLCMPLTADACAFAGGTYSGDDTDCLDTDCTEPPPPATGACCVNGACRTLTDAACAAAGGAFSGEDSLCEETDCTMPAAVGSGCGFAHWKTATPRLRDYSHWPVQFTPDDALANVFTIPACITDPDVQNGTLLSALQLGGGPGVNGGARLLLRAGVAALLNAQLTQNATCSSAYPVVNAQNVIDIVNQALARCNREHSHQLELIFNSYNNLNCPMNVHGNCK